MPQPHTTQQQTHSAIPAHRHGCTHEHHAQLKCPADGTPLCYYSGFLGYESYKCPRCGYDANDATTEKAEAEARAAVAQAEG